MASKTASAWDSSEETAVEDNYVQRTLAKEKPLPPISVTNWYKNVNWISATVLVLVPILSFYGALTTRLTWQTALWAVIYYFYTGLGITAGYHRLWAHRSYTASRPLQYFLMLAGSGAVQGSIRWWSRGHRAHHRYSDTDLDPYAVHRGLFHAHLGWMIWKPRRKPGVADVSDLSKNEVIRFQHKFYLPLLVMMGFVFPTLVAGLGWGDWRGGYFYAGACRLLFVHHSTFCVNSLAHYLGDTPFDDKHTPRDHVLTAFVTIGEGYHNFHHQFPTDYRNAILWHQYDPTKWFIATCNVLGLASHLKEFPANEIAKGRYNMQLKQLDQRAKSIEWAKPSQDLPVLSWDEYQRQAKESGRLLVAVSGFIHDVTQFAEEHPGGFHLIKSRTGKDATTAFHGGVYNHSNAAHNLLSMLRVGVLEGGMEVEHLKSMPFSLATDLSKTSEIPKSTADLKVPTASRDAPLKPVSIAA